MSSMLKKTGGLSFKPKAGRRPGAASASQPAPSQTTSRAPTTEPAAHSATSTPAPAAAPAPAPTPPASSSASAPVVASETQVPRQQEKQPSAEPQQDVQSARSDKPPAATTRPPQPTAPAPTPPPTLPAVQSASLERQAPAASIPASSVTRIQESVSTPASSPPPTQSSTSGTGASEPASRRPLPESSPAIPQSALPSAPKVAPTASAPAPSAPGLPSPAVTAISRTSAAPGRSLLSPSPFPVSDTINAAPTPDQSQANSSAETGPSAAAPKPKRRYQRRQQPEDGEGASNGEGATAAPKPKRQRKRKAPEANGQGGGEVTTDGEVAASAPKRYRRRQREPTPEHDEDGKPNHATTKLADLTRDLGIGKAFKHADLIAERARQARHEAKMRKLEKQKRAMGLLAPGDAASEAASRAGTPAAAAPAEPVNVNRGQGIDFDIVDGQIIINQNSLVINQHAAEGQIEMETVEEDEFTHLTTSASYMRPSRAMGSNHWSDEETERFYHYLTMFGTDFETISHVFPGKNRRQVKLKFNREEKARPNRINAAIMARSQKKVAIDLDDYKANRAASAADDTWITQDKFLAETEQLRKEQERELEVKRQERRDLGLLDDKPATATDEKPEGEQVVDGDGEEGQEEEEIIEDDADVGGAAEMITA
ncbi:hypothetical protein JX266_000635 [Neoarthrinium moseri]|nr:hypothetical protein JX266_000635 [Neoarthrinium moseri]